MRCYANVTEGESAGGATQAGGGGTGGTCADTGGGGSTHIKRALMALLPGSTW